MALQIIAALTVRTEGSKLGGPFQVAQQCHEAPGEDFWGKGRGLGHVGEHAVEDVSDEGGREREAYMRTDAQMVGQAG
jgi:hypothetical protein